MKNLKSSDINELHSITKVEIEKIKPIYEDSGFSFKDTLVELLANVKYEGTFFNQKRLKRLKLSADYIEGETGKKITDEEIKNYLAFSNGNLYKAARIMESKYLEPLHINDYVKELGEYDLYKKVRNIGYINRHDSLYIMKDSNENYLLAQKSSASNSFMNFSLTKKEVDQVINEGYVNLNLYREPNKVFNLYLDGKTYKLSSDDFFDFRDKYELSFSGLAYWDNYQLPKWVKKELKNKKLLREIFVASARVFNYTLEYNEMTINNYSSTTGFSVALFYASNKTKKFKVYNYLKSLEYLRGDVATDQVMELAYREYHYGAGDDYKKYAKKLKVSTNELKFCEKCNKPFLKREKQKDESCAYCSKEKSKPNEFYLKKLKLEKIYNEKKKDQ